MIAVLTVTGSAALAAEPPAGNATNRYTPQGTRNVLLNASDITDEGLVVLRRFSRLEVLSLDGTSVSGDGLQYLAGCPGLIGLSISGTPLNDDGLPHIGQYVQQLEWLNLIETNVTDNGLKHLPQMPSLKRIILGGGVSEAGAKRLQDQMPNCMISRMAED